jgi:hypothetical protein
MKILSLPDTVALLPTISEAWRKQQYPHTLSYAYKGLLDLGRPPALVYFVIAKFAEQWALEHLLEEHNATMVTTAYPVVVWALMDDVVQEAKKLEEGEA